jgi:hypothetical protein
MSDSETDSDLYTSREDMPQRTSSAPPILEVQEQSLFAMGNNYARLFAGAADIRADDDYIHFYNSHPDPSKLPPPIERQVFDSIEDEFQYSPGMSPPMARNFLPYHHDERDGSPRWSRPMPHRVASISSLEDYSLDETSLIPDLSSDSESISSSVDDISSLVHNMALMNGQSMAEKLAERFAASRLWEAENLENGRSSPLDEPSPPPKSPVSSGGLQPPPGLSVSAVEQSLNDLEISGDVPLQRRKEPRRGAQAAAPADSSTIPCRYYAQGYCSRGDRCNFAHVDTESTDAPSGGPSAISSSTPARSATPPATQPVSVPAPGSGGKGGKKGSQSQTRKRRSSNGVTAGQTGGSGAASGAGASGAANAQSFVIGTNTLAGRYTSIDQVIGQIYPMCKDQHGCRFLQKKLDEMNTQTVDIIFNEVYPHFAELMTDPFGNYLCQKLLEHCQEKQRLLLIESVANDLVRISQNMHGTRAVQKMIECLKSGAEIRLVTRGLKAAVVPLIKDLNGNHVVQRCLNHLSAQDNQFIYDAVAGHCVEVATHRHGCCVLQRCIDHASEAQKLQLVNEITTNGLTLVKDPYGNYVVQYVLDLPYPRMLANLILQFKTHLSELSTQKFSSNVVEKCLNVCDPVTRAWMVKELTESEHLKSLIQDPFGNYVIQTAMTVAEPPQHAKLVEGIKPFLFALRNTPYGKRIQNKIMKDGPDPQQQRQRSPGGHSHPGAAAQSFPRRNKHMVY